jgi:hypothetical protein
MGMPIFAAGQQESGPKVINVWSFTDEVPKMLEKYKELHPDFDYEIKTTIIATTVPRAHSSSSIPKAMRHNSRHPTKASAFRSMHS